ncbi:universal stress protein [Lipingzhangella sp. LS1_29]|uniref:Universal stress protein n=1 Tax=Lipingzhangella rawalii TaxID=2055835 RepID=A0ABU2H980_9ACTN|nr:universal stress protein [Lipingzhangella rawalii]MDS1271874.1 universal stress protein [Lipingzhangella rawalii]
MSHPPEQVPVSERPEILVGVDGSAPAMTALDWAAEEATLRNGQLHLLFARNDPGPAVPYLPAEPPPEEESTLASDTPLLEAARRVTASHPHLPVRTNVSKRDPATALLDAAPAATLVVVGSRGLSTISAMFRGSVGLRVAAHAPVPVAVIPPAASHTAERMGHVVVGVDGSELSDAALRFALDEALRRDASLTVVHAWYVPVPLDPAALAASGYTVDQEEACSRAHARVETLVAEARSTRTAEVPVQIVIGVNHPAHVLLTESATAALVVVGSRGRGGFRGLLLGSVSQALLQHATVPVVVVRNQDVSVAEPAQDTTWQSAGAP